MEVGIANTSIYYTLWYISNNGEEPKKLASYIGVKKFNLMINKNGCNGKKWIPVFTGMTFEGIY